MWMSCCFGCKMVQTIKLNYLRVNLVHQVKELLVHGIVGLFRCRIHFTKGFRNACFDIVSFQLSSTWLWGGFRTGFHLNWRRLVWSPHSWAQGGYPCMRFETWCRIFRTIWIWTGIFPWNSNGGWLGYWKGRNRQKNYFCDVANFSEFRL